MSEGPRRAGAPARDLVGAPFLDDAERDEADWLLARDKDPGAPAPSPAIARAYAEMEDLLGDLPAGSSDESWHDEVLRRATASPRPSRPWWRQRIYQRALGGGALVAAAAAAVAVAVLRPAAGRGDELQIAIRPGDLARGDSRRALAGTREALLEDRLLIRARPRGAADLRVYRADGVLVARCPEGPGCATAPPGEHAIDVKLDAPVRHHVILVVGAAGRLPAGTMDTYLEAARAAKARIIQYPPIDVR